MLTLFLAHIFRALPQDITQGEGCAPASKRQSRGPAWLGNSTFTGLLPGSCGAAHHPLPNVHHGGWPQGRVV